MKDAEPQWEWYRTFLHVLETGSLSAAGRAIGLTQPTVGRHIDSLEATLGVKLFTRSFDGFAPTDVARELEPYAAATAATVAALRRVASSHGSDVRGTVRLTASEVIGVEVLPPILADLRVRNPELSIEVVLSNQVADLMHREADIAIRMVQPLQDALVARKVGSVELGLHAHQRYLDTHGLPTSMDDLGRHTLVGFDTENEFIRKQRDKLPAFSRAALGFRADSDLAQLGAIRAGFGIGVCQVALAARDRSLVRVLKKDFSLAMPTWIAMHEDLRDSPRCAATFAALIKGLSAYTSGKSI
jgi:DNA-binding transcriptional LysR family regulator